MNSLSIHENYMYRALHIAKKVQELSLIIKW